MIYVRTHISIFTSINVERIYVHTIYSSKCETAGDAYAFNRTYVNKHTHKFFKFRNVFTFIENKLVLTFVFLSTYEVGK